MSSELEKQQAATTVTQEASGADLLNRILTEGRLTRSKDKDLKANEESYAREMISEFVKQAMDGQLSMSADSEAAINAHIAAIDKLLSAQLNEIMHHEAFQKLEGSWRGLNYLVMNSETGEDIKIRVLNATKQDLVQNFKKAAEFDQSALFKKVYEAGFGIFGGSPYGALIGDFEFTYHPQDVFLLKSIASVAASAHAPFIAAASSQLFGWESYTELSDRRDLASIFDNPLYADYLSFRQSEDSRYVGLTLPRTLMRLPYGEETTPVRSFRFEEDVDGKDHRKYLWGNAAYAFGTRLTDSFAKHHWCATIRGVESGGIVEDLPTHTFKTDMGDVALKCPTEIGITDRREKEFSDLGFIPLVHCQGTNYAAFFGAQSAQKPKSYFGDSGKPAEANARLSTQLPYIFAVSRFAHYLKAMMRDKIGAYMEREDCERFLNEWIREYVIENESAGPQLKAEKPLKEARVEVESVPGRPGSYRAVAYLRPHFQLEELTVSLRLVAELPESQGKG